MFRHRLSSKLALCTLSAFIIAAFIFSGTHFVGSVWIDHKFQDAAFAERQQQSELQNLQEHISSCKASALDYHLVSNWVKERELTSLSLYYGERLIYDSTISYHAGNLLSGRVTAPLPWQKTYPLRFRDVEVTAVVSTFARHRFEDQLNFVCLAVFFFVFLLIMLWYMHKKVVYIHRLAKEIRNMEAGNLNNPITLRGNDELSALAQDVDKMRHALLRQMILFQKARKDRDQFAVHMSHDLRTPITSLIGYLDIVNQKRYPDQSIQEQYLHKAEEKALQLKNLSENMFSHFMVSMDEAQSDNAFCDNATVDSLIQDGVFMLESQLLQAVVAKAPQEDGVFFAIKKASLQRILDNIFSNLLKYADPTFPIEIEFKKTEQMLTLSFSNHTLQKNSDTVASAGVGLKSAREIASQSGGMLQITKEASLFRINLSLCVISETS
ncbi:histidine kinase dimerization/phospho-acceptor domain-containing protein [Oscillibacter sp. GMB15532]|uniref:sensor histidine kinase n=1 Tax=Oscillibacter sp. GMB15532 TaxID=3230022 RepID=UPI0034DEA700